MENSTTTTLVITDDVMTSTATPHHATRCPKGWAVTWLGDRTVTRNQATTAMLIAVEVATKDLDADQTARWLIEDLAGELDLGMFEAIAMVTGIEATRDLPGFVGDAHDQWREDEYEAQLEAERTAEPAELVDLGLVVRTERVLARIEPSGVPRATMSGLVARIERVLARVEPNGPQAVRMFAILMHAVLTDIESSEDEDDPPLFLAEELAGLIGHLIRGEWRPVAEALDARKASHKSQNGS